MTPGADDSWLGALGVALGADVRRTRAVHGGDVARAVCAELADGRTVFAKTRAGAPADVFVTEASSLGWLDVPGAPAVPRVLAVGEHPPFLALEWVERGERGPDTEQAFGQQLATLHLAGAPSFGREDRRTTGSRGLPNDPAPDWAEFYRSRRLVPLAQLAEASGALDARTVRQLRTLAERLPELVGPAEPPARLHGDLWAGNRLVGAGGHNWLIDPASFGGHREFDLAMMRLFGGFGEAAFRAYDEVYPLAHGWAERVELHQVAPLVVHAIKFGGGYVAAATDAIRGYL